MKKNIALITLSCCFGSALASSHWQTTAQLIPGYQNQLNTFEKNTGCQLTLPCSLPQATIKRYYLHTEKNFAGCVAYIDSTQDCKGAHYCNIGSIITKQGGKKDASVKIDFKHPSHNSVSTDKHGNVMQHITLKSSVQSEVIIDADNKQSYAYTPGHAQADFANAQLQWTTQGKLITLIYPSSQDNLITMATSINQQQCT